jgi:tRNA-2-methylthio-N6-dimethylallyladenosine synthase
METYGCQMNIGDTELMEGLLAERGFFRVPEAAGADVILINTCAIREHAERRVFGRIGQLQQHRRERPDLILGVTGCMGQRLGRQLIEETRGVDFVAGPDAYRRLAELIDSMQHGALERGQVLLGLDAAEDYEGIESVRAEGVSAWITVQRGCDHRCTFCIVPYVRGPEKNRRPEAILDEVRRAAGNGFTEVVLLGQTVNSYRRADNDVTESLLDVMSEQEEVCRQLHLPVQSGANRILKRMVRRYTVEDFLARAELSRERVPDIALSTDVIVAFPGESEEEFESTLELMREVRFDDAYLYRYSRRESTPATRFPEGDFVPDDVGAERLERLIEVQREIQREVNEAEVGRVCEVLVEREARSAGDVLGRTEQNKVVAFADETNVVGEYVDVRLTGTTGATFMGRRV